MSDMTSVYRYPYSETLVVSFETPPAFRKIVSLHGLQRVDNSEIDYRPKLGNYRIDYYDGDKRVIIEYPNLSDIFFDNGLLSCKEKMNNNDKRWLIKMASRPAEATPFLLYETRNWLSYFLISNRIEFNVVFNKQNSFYSIYSTNEEDLLHYKLSM